MIVGFTPLEEYMDSVSVPETLCYLYSLPTSLEEPARVVVFLWLNLVRLYSLYKLLYPQKEDIILLYIGYHRIPPNKCYSQESAEPTAQPWFVSVLPEDGFGGFPKTGVPF